MRDRKESEIEIRLRLLLEEKERYFFRLENIRLTYLQSVDSTQLFISETLKSNTEGDLVISETQTAGRGREGRSWVSDKGGLWMTITLKPPAPELLERITPIAAASIIRTLSEYGLPGCKVKLPNDVCFNGRKIAGILADGMVQGNDSKVYLGIGININNDTSKDASISEIATSMAKELGRDVSLPEFVVTLLKNLDSSYYEALKALGL